MQPQSLSCFFFQAHWKAAKITNSVNQHPLQLANPDFEAGTHEKSMQLSCHLIEVEIAYLRKAPGLRHP